MCRRVASEGTSLFKRGPVRTDKCCVYHGRPSAVDWYAWYLLWPSPNTACTNHFVNLIPDAISTKKTKRIRHFSKGLLFYIYFKKTKNYLIYHGEITSQSEKLCSNNAFYLFITGVIRSEWETNPVYKESALGFLRKG